jgi:hypothetical protein
MSVFRVFKNGNDSEAELRGTAIAGNEFANSFARYPQKNLFAGFVRDLIVLHGCVVKYSPDGVNDFDILTDGTTNPTTGDFKFHYFDAAGVKKRMKLKSNVDNPNDNTVTMAVPSRAVQSTDPYLSDAVAQFERNDVTEPNKAAFLLGLLLFKRCR